MSSSIPNIIWLFFLAFSLNGFPVLFILLFKNKIFRTTNVLLAINLLGFTLASVVICLFETKLILKVPHLFRLPSPIYYLLFPVAYLYLKLILEDREYLKKREYLHFLLALIHFIEMVPFYLKLGDQKIVGLNKLFTHDILIYSHNEGWFPPFVHNVFRGCLGIIYVFAMCRLLRKARFVQTSSDTIHSGTIIYWLRLFTGLNGTLALTLVLTLGLVDLPSELRSLLLSFTFIIILWISNYYLFFHPEILYGLSESFPMDRVFNSAKKEIFSKSTKTNFEKFESKASSADNEQDVILPLVNQYKIQLNEYILGSECYLDPEFDMIDLSRDTGIPKHHLQLFIYKSEGKRFNDYINDYRLLHIQERINNGDSKKITLEALALESGFSSKSAFVRGTKKITGQTPKEFFRQPKSVD